MEHYDFIVVGGGIAGAICAETLAQQTDGEYSILVISASMVIKQLRNTVQVTKVIEHFEVFEQPFSSLQERCPAVSVVHNVVIDLDADQKIVKCEDGALYSFNHSVCLCTGGRANVIPGDERFVVSVRDTETADDLKKRLANARQVAIVGNGGISMELVYEIETCSIVWIVRDKHLNHVFFDEASAQFMLTELRKKETGQLKRKTKRIKYYADSSQSKSKVNKSSVRGCALGPDWTQSIELKGARKDSSWKLTVEYNTEVREIVSAERWQEVKDQYPMENDGDQHECPCYLILKNNKVIGCDFVISATGVLPNYEPFVKRRSKIQIQPGESGGIKVDDHMRTGEPNVFAAGDVATACWKEKAEDWFQMKLWPQAKQMGFHAAMCMLADARGDIENSVLPFFFELFEHCTYFVGMKVVLLGRYNCQGLDNYELLFRHIEGEEMIKLVIKDGKIRGAVLIGDTELEETIENLMLSSLDVSRYGEDLLNSDVVDLNDFFD